MSPELNIILYTATCSNCHQRKETNLLRSFARQNDLGYVMIRTDYALDYALEARHRSDLTPPLVYNESTGKSVAFHGVTEQSLQTLLAN